MKLELQLAQVDCGDYRHRKTVTKAIEDEIDSVSAKLNEARKKNSHLRITFKRERQQVMHAFVFMQKILTQFDRACP